MDNNFKKWWDTKPSCWRMLEHIFPFKSYKAAGETWNAAIQSIKNPQPEFGCFNSPYPPISNYCALDDNDDKDHCPHASRLYDEHRPKTDCEFWRPRHA